MDRDNARAVLSQLMKESCEPKDYCKALSEYILAKNSITAEVYAVITRAMTSLDCELDQLPCDDPGFKYMYNTVYMPIGDDDNEDGTVSGYGVLLKDLVHSILEERKRQALFDAMEEKALDDAEAILADDASSSEDEANEGAVDSTTTPEGDESEGDSIIELKPLEDYVDLATSIFDVEQPITNENWKIEGKKVYLVVGKCINSLVGQINNAGAHAATLATLAVNDCPSAADISSACSNALGDGVNFVKDKVAALTSIASDTSANFIDKVMTITKSVCGSSDTVSASTDDVGITAITINQSDYSGQTALNMWKTAFNSSVFSKAGSVIGFAVGVVFKAVVGVLTIGFNILKKAFCKFILPAFQTKDFVKNGVKTDEKHVDVPCVQEIMNFNIGDMREDALLELTSKPPQKFRIDMKSFIHPKLVGEVYDEVLYEEIQAPLNNLLAPHLKGLTPGGGYRNVGLYKVGILSDDRSSDVIYYEDDKNPKHRWNVSVHDAGPQVSRHYMSGMGDGWDYAEGIDSPNEYIHPYYRILHKISKILRDNYHASYKYYYDGSSNPNWGKKVLCVVDDTPKPYISSRKLVNGNTITYAYDLIIPLSHYRPGQGSYAKDLELTAYPYAETAHDDTDDIVIRDVARVSYGNLEQETINRWDEFFEDHTEIDPIITKNVVFWTGSYLTSKQKYGGSFSGPEIANAGAVLRKNPGFGGTMTPNDTWYIAPQTASGVAGYNKAGLPTGYTVNIVHNWDGRNMTTAKWGYDKKEPNTAWMSVYDKEAGVNWSNRYFNVAASCVGSMSFVPPHYTMGEQPTYSTSLSTGITFVSNSDIARYIPTTIAKSSLTGSLSPVHSVAWDVYKFKYIILQEVIPHGGLPEYTQVENFDAGYARRIKFVVQTQRAAGITFVVSCVLGKFGWSVSSFRVQHFTELCTWNEVRDGRTNELKAVDVTIDYANLRQYVKADNPEFIEYVRQEIESAIYAFFTPGAITKVRTKFAAIQAAQRPDGALEVFEQSFPVPLYCNNLFNRSSGECRWDIIYADLDGNENSSQPKFVFFKLKSGQSPDEEQWEYDRLYSVNEWINCIYDDSNDESGNMQDDEAGDREAHFRLQGANFLYKFAYLLARYAVEGISDSTAKSCISAFNTDFKALFTTKLIAKSSGAVSNADLVAACTTIPGGLNYGRSFIYYYLQLIIWNKRDLMSWHYASFDEFPDFYPYSEGNPLDAAKWHIRTNAENERIVSNFMTALVIAAVVIALAVIGFVISRKIKGAVRMARAKLDYQEQAIANNMWKNADKEQSLVDAFAKGTLSKKEYKAKLKECLKERKSLIKQKAKCMKKSAFLDKLSAFVGGNKSAEKELASVKQPTAIDAVMAEGAENNIVDERNTLLNLAENKALIQQTLQSAELSAELSQEGIDVSNLSSETITVMATSFPVLLQAMMNIRSKQDSSGAKPIIG